MGSGASAKLNSMSPSTKGGYIYQGVRMCVGVDECMRRRAVFVFCTVSSRPSPSSFVLALFLMYFNTTLSIWLYMYSLVSRHFLILFMCG